MELLTSKRVRIAVVAAVVWAAARFGLDIDPAAIDRILDLAIVLVASFGLSGFGKERSQQELDAAKAGVQVTRLELTTIPPPVATTEPPTPEVPPPLPLIPRGRQTPDTADLGAAARLLRPRPPEKP